MTQHLPPVPHRMAHLPRDHRGFPIPWFVAVVPGTGERDFRVADAAKRIKAVRHRLCWVCGEKIGRRLTFVIGPMCAVHRVTSEPGCHYDCAHFSATACPFLTRPRMRRNDKDLPQESKAADGIAIARNPGVTCLWTTDTFSPFNAGNGGWLLKLGDPERVEWWAHGNIASRDEVVASIESGYPLLLEIVKKDGVEAIDALARQHLAAQQWLPA